MSKFLSATSVAIMLAACGSNPSLSANPPSDGPAVWAVSDADTTVYLFGYTQVLKPGVDWQSEAFQAAFTAADTVILETEPATADTQGEIQQTLQNLGFYADGRTLIAALTEEQAKEVDTVSTGYGAPLAALDPLKPWLASIQLGVVAIASQGFDLSTPPSTVMLSAAKDAGKSIQFLESPTELMEKIAGLSEDEQIGLLLHGVRSLRDDPEQMDRLNAAWLAGDVAAIGKTLHGKDGAWSSDTVYSMMLTDRNTQWRDEIAVIMETQQGTYFLGVGLGHLAGKDSLVTMLSQDGYAVTRQ